MSVIFRDESSEPSSTMIGFSNATVTVPNHSLIERSNILLATAHATSYFVIRFYLSSDQKDKKNFIKTFSTPSQTRTLQLARAYQERDLDQITTD